MDSESFIMRNFTGKTIKFELIITYRFSFKTNEVYKSLDL